MYNSSTKGVFQGSNLLAAREARSTTITFLSETTGLSSRAISGFEKGDINPTFDSIDKIANVLNLPISFFLTEKRILKNNTVFFRSLRSTTSIDRKRLVRRLSWLKEIIAYMENYLDFIKPNLPELDIDSSNFKDISSEKIENISIKVRKHFGLKYGPISNLVRLCENNGILVSRGEVETDTIDAFSEWNWIENHHPIIFLGIDKGSAVRSRFDLAHELGHLILHKKIDKTEFNNKNLKVLEQQANDFASSFLLPEETFKKSFYFPSFDSLIIMKKKWHVSIAALIMRADKLGIISKKTVKNLWFNYSRRGYRRIGEPLDDIIKFEKPKFLSRSIKLLVESNIVNKEEIVEELKLSDKDIELLTNLEPGYLTDNFFNKDVLPRQKIFRIDDFRKEDD